MAEPERPVPEVASVRLFETCVAVPDRDAVMVPALKLPEASRATMAEAVFALVAVVAELGTPEIAPPSVRLPEEVTVPDSVMPLTVPVPDTEVTVPPVPVAAIVMPPELLVMVTPVPCVRFATV